MRGRGAAALLVAAVVVVALAATSAGSTHPASHEDAEDHPLPLRGVAAGRPWVPASAGRLSPLECPDGVVDGLPRWYGEETPARDPAGRARALGAPVRKAHPHARLRRTAGNGDALELSWVSPIGLRVGRVAFVRGDSGRWLVREWEWC